MIPEQSRPNLVFGDVRGSDGLPLAVDAMLTDRRPDGSVAGSYDARTMDELLRYHTMENVAPAAGRMVLGGEAFEA